MFPLMVLLVFLKHAAIDSALNDGEIHHAVQLMNQNPECPDLDCHQRHSNPCDYSCRVYSDCCSKIKKATLPPDPFPKFPKRWQCRPLPSVKGTMWLYMVSSCPTQWKDIQVSLLCSKSDRLPLASYSHSLDIPVLSATSNILYANVYCAMCNNDFQEITSIPMTIACKNAPQSACNRLLGTAEYLPGDLQWVSGNITMTAYIQFPASKQCTELHNKCKSENKTKVLDHKQDCLWYTDPMNASHLNSAYEQDACLRILTSVAVCAGAIPRSRASPPFSLILDFQGGGRVGMSSSCTANNQMYDTMRKSCIHIFCGRNFEMGQEGRCVAKVNSTEHGGLTDACVKIVVSQYEYTYVNTSTIRVNRTGIEFETGSFEIGDDGSVLICAPDTVIAYTNKFSAAQGLLSSVCLSLSLSCLAVHILVYGSIEKLRNLPGKNLLSLSCSIFVAQFLFYAGINLKRPRVVCVAIGATTHLSYLASFFWMNVMAFDMCRTFTAKSVHRGGPSQQRQTFARYATYAWMWPCLLVSAALMLDATEAVPNLKPRYAEPYCWINTRMSLAIFLALPLLVLLVENVIFFTMTACAIKKATADAAMAVNGSTASERIRFVLYVKLAVIVGLPWIFGYVAALADIEPLWYLFIIFNSLQGTFIFFAFTFKRKILSMVLDKLPRKFVHPRVRGAATQSTITTIRTTDSFT